MRRQPAPVLDVSIETLLLDGLSVGGEEIGEAVRHALSEALGAGPDMLATARSNRVARVDGGVVDLAAGAPAARIGAGIARAVSRQLGR